MLRRLLLTLLLCLVAAPSYATRPTNIGGGSHGANPSSLNTLVLDANVATPLSQSFTFSSANDVANFYGSGATPTALATQFYSGYGGSTASYLGARFCAGGCRARIFSAPVNQTLSVLPTQCPTLTPCSLTFNYDGWTVTANNIDLSGVTTLGNLASTLESEIDGPCFSVTNPNTCLAPGSTPIGGNTPTNLPALATISNASIASVSCGFTGYATEGMLYVTAMTSTNCLVTGTVFNLAGVNGGAGHNGEIQNQDSGTTGGVGAYVTDSCCNGSLGASATITAHYGQLSIDPAATVVGIVRTGQSLTDSTGNVLQGSTAIHAYISGGTVTGPDANGNFSCTNSGCQGTNWSVRNQTVAAETMATIPCYLDIVANTITNAPQNNQRLEISHHTECGYYPTGTMAFATGSALSPPYNSAANLLGIANGSTGLNSIGTVYPVYRSPTSEYQSPSTIGGILDTLAAENPNFTYLQISQDPDDGNWPATMDLAIQTWATANVKTYLTPVWQSTMYPVVSYPPPACTPGNQVFTSTGTLTPRYCPRMSVFALGSGGRSAAGTATASGASGAAGGFCGLAGATTNAGLTTLSVTVGTPGSATNTSVTDSLGVLTGSLDASIGGNASGITAGSVGTQTCNATAVGSNTGVAIAVNSQAGFVGKAGQTLAGGGAAGGSSSKDDIALGKGGGTSSAGGGSGGAGTFAVGVNAGATSGSQGGSGAPSGTPSGGATAAINNPCNAAGTAASGQDGAGGSGGPAANSTHVAQAGCAGSAGQYYSSITNYSIPNFGAGGGGGGGGGSTQTAGFANGGNGANGGNYGASGGGGGASTNGTPGVAGTSASGALGVSWGNQ